MSPAAKKRSSVSPAASKAASSLLVAEALTTERLADAVAQLSARDAKLAAAIAAVGPCTLLPRTEGTHFGHLARNIVYQQLSGAAAATIHGRFLKHVSAHLGVETEHPTPDSVLAIDDDALRTCGLSVAKVRAIKDLAQHVVDGRLPLDRLEAMHDQDIVDALVPVRGIGPWTAQMFLMFRLGRPDVLPVLDLGVRKGAQRIYRTRALPDAARLEKIAKTWRPWASVASWYCWRVLDLEDAGGW
ncbi:MAG TPA: DNA-3-methyladenine glycosylase [Gemmatimonas sp.]|uniref:DNA-3-methyladenine glycosylase family protein n=1 Tax=Gemmatimonas sp. TaxID=1962908 RepID=UPI002ED9568E